MNKITKLLSVFVLAGAIGAGVAGVSACKSKDDDSSDSGYEQGNDLVIAANVTGIIVEGVSSETITLSTTKTSHTINKSAIKVYFATGTNADQKGTEVPAANVTLELKDSNNAPVSSWENIKADGVYKVVAGVKNATMANGATATLADLKKTINITISNPAQDGTLAVKAGATLEQAQSPTDSMTSTWTYEVTLANGDKKDVPASEVTVTGLDTTTAAESATATLTWGTVTGTVTYKITANANQHIVSTGYVFGASDEAASVAVGTEFKQGENTMLTLTSGNAAKVTATSSEAESSYTEGGVTRRFYYRLQFGGGTWKSDKAVNGDKAGRLEFTTTGAGVITLYYATNGGKDSVLNPEDGTKAEGDTKYGRGIGVYSGNIGNSDEVNCLGRDVAEDKLVHKFRVNIPEAGTYWIATANEKDIYFFGYQLDTVVNEAGDNVGLPTATEISAIKLTVADKEEDGETSKELTVGGKFESWVTAIKTVAWNPVSAVVSEENVDDISTATYTIKTSSMAEAVAVTADSDITAEMLGEATITVTYNGNSATYKATVKSTVGVTGITAALVEGTSTQVETAAGKFELTKDKVAVKTKETVEGVTVTEYVVKYNGEDIGEGVELAASETAYVITVEATVSNGTDSAPFTTTFNLSITVKPAGDYETTTIELVGSKALYKDAAGENVPVEDASGSALKSPALANDTDTRYYVYTKGTDGAEDTKTIISVGGKAQWKFKDMLQGDGAKRYLYIDLSAYEGTKVKIEITCCNAKNNGNGVAVTKLQLGTDTSTAVELPYADADGATENVVTFNTQGGGEACLYNTENAIRYYKIVITPVA